MPSEITLSKPARAERVLVADDDQLFRILLQRNVTRWGYECTVASDGEEAWQYLSQADGPCLAILDWIMPGMDGLEVCRRLRESDLPHYVYVMLLTARTDSYDLARGLEAGADDYVPKPIDLEELRLRLKAGARIVASEARQQSSRRQTELILDQVRRVAARLFHTQDEERQRIARTLHDKIAQVLTSVLMNLSCLEAGETHDAAKREALSGIAASTADCVRELRSVAYLLHPPLLDEIGLVSALRGYADGIAQQTGVAVDLHIPGDLGRFDSALEMTLFRIAQEAVTNVHRHSGSRRAILRLAKTPREIRLEIQDEGCGFPPGFLEDRAIWPLSGGVGILGMRERAEQRGGQLEIQSTGQGATVIATLPIPAEAAAVQPEVAAGEG